VNSWLASNGGSRWPCGKTFSRFDRPARDGTSDPCIRDRRDRTNSASGLPSARASCQAACVLTKLSTLPGLSALHCGSTPPLMYSREIHSGRFDAVENLDGDRLRVAQQHRAGHELAQQRKDLAQMCLAARRKAPAALEQIGVDGACSARKNRASAVRCPPLPRADATRAAGCSGTSSSTPRAGAPAPGPCGCGRSVLTRPAFSSETYGMRQRTGQRPARRSAG
jgi:hypothetical protein